MDNLQKLDAPRITINFGQVARFENGLGVWVPGPGNNDQFHLLRSKVLQGLFVTLPKPEPHITLMHPGNSACTDEIFSIIQKVSLPTQLTFDTISLIEQINGGQWQMLKSYQLTGN